MIQPYILATAGHVDHGKSSLVKALTGTDPDRLPEEKARGITIDLGFAHLLLPHPHHDPNHEPPRLPRRLAAEKTLFETEQTEPGRLCHLPAPSRFGVPLRVPDSENAPNHDPAQSPTHFSCGIVDVPGHEDFVKNMVAGVGAVDLALLVIAADDGWMPQTEEHLQILEYLGVTRAVVALTKSDLATDLEAQRIRIREKLQGTPFATADIIPTSIPSLAGMNSLRAALAETLASTPPPPDFGKPRLAIDRVFVLNGVGTVVTGTLTGGILAEGDVVVLHPSGRKSRIRSCQTHGRDTNRVLPGTRTALNLTDIDASEVARGDVVSLQGLGDPTPILDTLTIRSPRPSWGPSLCKRALTRGMPIRFHLGSAHISGRIHPLEGEALETGSRMLAQIRLDTPVLAFAGDHFLLRDSTGRATLAGGVILDPDARRPQARHPERLTALHACAQNVQRPDPFIAAALRRHGCLPMATLLDRSRFAATAIRESAERWVSQQLALRTTTHLVSTSLWDAALARMAASIEQHHAAHPEAIGLPVSELRSLLHTQPHLDDLWESLIASLTQARFQIDGTTIRRTRHRPSLPPALESAGRTIRTRLQANPFDPPPRHELTVDASSRQALGFLIQERSVIEIGPDLVLDRMAFEFARRKVLLHLKRHGQATASDLRQLLGTTRRVLIPLLERLERDGETRRVGEFHKLRRTIPESGE